MAHPLEIAARIAMEDVSILMKNEDNEHYLWVPEDILSSVDGN
jgi:hypothetical protein